MYPFAILNVFQELRGYQSKVAWFSYVSNPLPSPLRLFKKILADALINIV